MEPCVLSHLDNYWFGVRSNGQILKDTMYWSVVNKIFIVVNKAVLAQW